MWAWSQDDFRAAQDASLIFFFVFLLLWKILFDVFLKSVPDLENKVGTLLIFSKSFEEAELDETSMPTPIFCFRSDSTVSHVSARLTGLTLPRTRSPSTSDSSCPCFCCRGRAHDKMMKLITHIDFNAAFMKRLQRLIYNWTFNPFFRRPASQRKCKPSVQPETRTARNLPKPPPHLIQCLTESTFTPFVKFTLFKLIFEWLF